MKITLPFLTALLLASLAAPTHAAGDAAPVASWSFELVRESTVVDTVGGHAGTPCSMFP